MSKDIKKDIKDTNVKSVAKDVRIEINGLNDKKFVLSGPPASIVELENVAYALMSEIIIYKWRDSFIKNEKAMNEKARLENTSVEEAKKEEAIIDKK